MSSRVPSSPVSSCRIGSNPEHIINMLKYRISPDIYLPHIERGRTLLELLDILGKDSNSEESVEEHETEEEELVPVKIEYEEEEKESESDDSNDNDVDNVLVPVKIEYEEEELQVEEEKEPENGDSDDIDVHKVLTPVKTEHEEEELVPVKIEYGEDELQEEEMKETENGDSDDNDIDNVQVPVKIEHDKDTEKLHPVETVATNKSVNEGVCEEWDPTNDMDFYVELFTSEGGLKEADVTKSGRQKSASSIREKGKLCVEYQNKKGEVNEKEQEEGNDDEEEEGENDNEGEEEVEEEGEELQEEEKERDSVDSDDNDVHNLVLVPVNIEHEQNTENEIEKHKSKDEKLHPVETVETRKSLHERETEDWDPQNDIDAAVELFTPDGGSKEADGKQSGRQKSASSIRKKEKRFRITRRCEICSASTDDMSKHLERTHKLSKEERQKYLLAARGRIPIRRRAMIENPNTGRKQSKRADCPLCQGKNYTSLHNHFKTKHGLEANEAKEIRKRMKQGVELDEAYGLGTDAADPEREEPEREEHLKEHQESLEDAGMNKKQIQTEEESDDEDNEDDEGDDKDEDWVPPRDWKNTRQQEYYGTNVEKENKKGEENERIEEDEEDNDQEEEEEVQKVEDDNEGEGEEEEDDDTEEGEKEPESVDNDVHKLLVPVNIGHEKRTENEKHESKDKKLHPVETVETSKSLDERETEELDPKHDIDASVELLTPDGGSKEADGKQSGRQKSASSIKKKVKRFRITRVCEICSASTDDMSKHLERTHKLSKEERQKYILAARGRVPIRRRAMIENPSSGRKESKRENCPLCEGKHYTSLQNHLETKHGLEANEAKEIRKRMKQEKQFRITRCCEIRSTDDMSKHLARTHKLSKEERQKHTSLLNPLKSKHGLETNEAKETRKHKSKDEQLHPVETVETSKSLDERETEELDPKNDIDASVERFTSEDGSKETDVKQSGRQKSASSIRKKVKRFRITRHCEICSASTDDMSKHLERTHKLSKEERQKYILAARGRVPIRRRAMIENPSSGRKESKRENCPLCEGKHYTSLQNHLETKHGLEANEAKEIRKRMKQEKQFRTTRCCEIRSTDDMSKHLARTHKLSKEERQKHTSLLNPLKSKHGLETNEAKETHKHKSKDEKLHPVETVETSKSLDERETEEMDPKNDIDASVERFTSEGDSKEADVKQSGRQKLASSIRKKGKRFRITRHCEICSASTDDMSKHLERTHKLSKEERQKYILAARGRVPIRRREMIENPSSGRKQSKRENCPLCEGKHYTSLQNHLETKHGLEANEAKEIRKRMKQGFVKRAPGAELDEAHQLGTDAADSETNDLLSRYRSFINLACDTTYGESSSTQHCRQLKNMCEMAFSKLLKGGLTPGINVG